MKKIKRHTQLLLWTMLSVFLGIFVFGSFLNKAIAQGDTDHDGVSDLKENELAEKYAPYLNFAAGEQFFPTEIEYHLDNSVLKQRSGTGYVVVDLSLIHISEPTRPY